MSYDESRPRWHIFSLLFVLNRNVDKILHTVHYNHNTVVFNSVVLRAVSHKASFDANC